MRPVAELMFVEAIRRHIADAGESAGWLAGLGDPVVGRALAALHSDPAREWTLEALAAETGASRSILAERQKGPFSSIEDLVDRCLSDSRPAM